MIFKLLGIAFVGLVCSLVVKQYKPEIAVLINISTGVIIFAFLFDYIQTLINSFIQFSSNVNLSSNIIALLIKVIGIGYIVEFSADIAEDAGNGAIANKIVFGGKIVIAVLSLPVILDLFELLLNML